MIVCICNNINEHKVVEALSEGWNTTREVLRYHQCHLKCCRCVPEIKKLKEGLGEET